MLIMTLAYAQRANDTPYLSQHYAILDQWTQYLIEEALIPANQISTDDFAGALAYVRRFCVCDIVCADVMSKETKQIWHLRALSVFKPWL